MSLLTHTHTNTPPPSLSPSLPLPIPPSSSWSWKKFCGVAITQVFYQSFQRRKIRAIVSGWSYGQKLHTYWVHLRLWLRSLHWWGPLLGNGAFEAVDWDWEQMQPHHTLLHPSHPSKVSPLFHLNIPPPPPTPKSPSPPQPTQQAFVLILLPLSLIEYKLQQCFRLRRLSSKLRSNLRVFWQIIHLTQLHLSRLTPLLLITHFLLSPSPCSAVLAWWWF